MSSHPIYYSPQTCDHAHSALTQLHPTIAPLLREQNKAIRNGIVLLYDQGSRSLRRFEGFWAQMRDPDVYQQRAPSGYELVVRQHDLATGNFLCNCAVDNTIPRAAAIPRVEHDGSGVYRLRCHKKPTVEGNQIIWSETCGLNIPLPFWTVNPTQRVHKTNVDSVPEFGIKLPYISRTGSSVPRPSSSSQTGSSHAASSSRGSSPGLSDGEDFWPTLTSLKRKARGSVPKDKPTPLKRYKTFGNGPAKPIDLTFSPVKDMQKMSASLARAHELLPDFVDPTGGLDIVHTAELMAILAPEQCTECGLSYAGDAFKAHVEMHVGRD